MTPLVTPSVQPDKRNRQYAQQQLHREQRARRDKAPEAAISAAAVSARKRSAVVKTNQSSPPATP